MKALNFDLFLDAQKHSALGGWLQKIKPEINRRTAPESHGDLPRWMQALDALPPVPTQDIKLNEPAITTVAEPTSTETLQQISETLKQLHPWRKGPFRIHGTYIDSEWKCDRKWSRLAPHIDLHGKSILDIGCGNGYYCLRMIGAGAQVVVGIDPNLLFCTQFQAINKYAQQSAACVLPLGVEILEQHSQRFDTVFSMGVLYHRRQPLEHLNLLARCLHDDGELVLETLVIKGTEPNELIPAERYANMRNVWSLPTVSLLIQQLLSSGFRNVRCVDVTQTSIKEQRSTDWMRFHSLQQALDPNDPDYTIEGSPAPLRAILVARK